MVHFYHSDRFVPRLPDGHRFPIEKYGLVREQLLYEGIIDNANLTEAPMADEADLLRVHSHRYWQALRDQQLSLREVRRMGFPQSAELVERSRRSVQGTLLATQHALDHGCGVNLAGGTHHAYADHGEGFCLLNDIAVAARWLLAHRKLRQLLIVDLDVHQGNGNAVIFAQEPAVFTFSMHCQDNYPLRKERSDLDLGLAAHTDDATYLRLLRDTLPPLIERLRPDLIFYQAGVDVLATDKLGQLALTPQGCKQRDEVVLDLCARYQIPVAISMGGGYSLRVADIVSAHTNTFRLAVDRFGS
jgi:acetoin utilization deacetylase AcuC-like enzyme